MYVTAHNVTDQPVPIDGDGRQLDGHAWGPVLTTTDEVKAALDDGRLVKVSRPGKGADLNPDAAAAFDATDELEKARKKGPEELAAAVDDVGGATPTRSAARAAASEEG